MLRSKRGVSIISLMLCAIAITLVTTALVVATTNSAMYRAQVMAEKQAKQARVVDASAYTKIYSRGEIETIAKQAFADNYLSFYDKEVDLLGFEALVLGDILQIVPEKQLDNYIVYVTSDGVNVVPK